MNQNYMSVRAAASLRLEQKLAAGATSFTTVEVHDAVSAALSFLGAEEVDIDLLVADLEASFRTRIGSARTLEGDVENWEPWLGQRKGEIEWSFWNRYEQYLRLDRGWPQTTLRKLEDTTDRILGLLTDPQRTGPWDRRGMVVGDVQSGKTSNYIGLIAKAADAGYKLVVILAGFHNSLRSQTQIRLEEGFLGYDRGAVTGGGARKVVGVGHVDPQPTADSITTRADDGDFKRQVANQFGITPGGHPLLFVVKKHWSVLTNLLNWVEFSANARDADGRPYVEGVPLLVVDDEADQGSVDTKQQEVDEFGEPDREHDPTAINQRIRRLLHLFDQSAYVGYTATPFANIFIHEKGKTDEEGEDLFPRSFIVSLPTPSDHVGPARIFGYEGDGEQIEGLPIIRIVDDHVRAPDDPETASSWMPQRHKKEHVPLYRGEDDLPPTLREAIRAFVLACAARTARGHGSEHNSMLVHVTRFTAVQARVHEQVAEELNDIQRRLRLGDGDSPDAVLDELRDLWEQDFHPTSEEIRSVRPDPVARPVSWSDVEPLLSQAAQSIQVRQINGLAGEVLDYKTHEQNGLNVIAIGGDKLSRGLTLEGLTVSYFLRASRMYDTLMQMGRWFGYRPGYLDLCRLYTTTEMSEWFSHIAQASDELRADFDRMAATGGTPQDFGHRVKSHPLLLVTSQVKMRNGQPIDISFQGDISETIDFWRDRDSLESNWTAATQLIHLIETRGRSRDDSTYDRKVLWRDISPEAVLDFLAAYREHEASRKVRTRLLADYIRAENSRRRLRNWTVALVGGAAGHSIEFPEGRIDLVERRWHLDRDPARRRNQKAELMAENHFRIRRLVSPSDEELDLSPQLQEQALRLTRQDWTLNGCEGNEPARASGPRIRDVRDPDQGLLILYPVNGEDSHWADDLEKLEKTEKVESTATGIPVLGFAISFPTVDLASASKVRYIVNNVYFEQEVVGGVPS